MGKHTLLLVDDTPSNLAVLAGILKDDYKLRIATSGAKAIDLAQIEPQPTLILLDVMMPEMDGYETCQQLKSLITTQNIPILFLTAKTAINDETLGFNLGAVDFIHKPIVPAIVKARVQTHVELFLARKQIATENQRLEIRVSERTQELIELFDAMLLSMGIIAEIRDNETGNHIRRTALYVQRLAEEILKRQIYPQEFHGEMTNDLIKAAPLHDIGKVGVPDQILLKPDKLSVEEFEIMKTHTTIGHDMIVKVEENLSGKHQIFQFAKEIAYSHQEKWDGSGYPQGLRGLEIPISARIMAIADVYDALISHRPYKKAFSHGDSVRIIAEGRGRHFDPLLTDVFLEISDDFQHIAQLHRDAS